LFINILLLVLSLRYGWFYAHEPRSSGIPSTPIPDKPVVAGGATAKLEETLCGEQDMVEASKEYRETDVGIAVSETVAQKVGNAAVDPMKS